MDELILGDYSHIRIIDTLCMIKYNKEKEYEDKELQTYSIEKLMETGCKIGYKNDTKKNKFYIYYDPYFNNNIKCIDFVYSFDIVKKDIKYIDLMCCDRIENRIFSDKDQYYFNTIDNGYYINYYYGFNFKIYFNSPISEDEFKTFELWTRNLIKDMNVELNVQIHFNNKYQKIYNLNQIYRRNNHVTEYGYDEDSDY